MPTRMCQSVRWEGLRFAQHTMTGAICLLMLAGCAGQGTFHSEVSQLRADQSSQNAALATLVTRVDGLDRRLMADAQTSEQMQQELKQAVEVLLKKALETERRLASLESARAGAKRSEKPASEVRRQAFAANGTAERQATKISLGMTQEEVGQILGNPISAERAGKYVFWQYSPLSNQRYVIFEQGNGRVSGWRGL